jgi:hypothetical protein
VELAFLAERSQPKINVTIPAPTKTRIKARFTLEPVYAAPYLHGNLYSVALMMSCHRGSRRLLVDRRDVVIIS